MTADEKEFSTVFSYAANIFWSFNTKIFEKIVNTEKKDSYLAYFILLYNAQLHTRSAVYFSLLHIIRERTSDYIIICFWVLVGVLLCIIDSWTIFLCEHKI